MKSSLLSTNNLSWDSSIIELCSNPKKPTKTVQSLLDNGNSSLKDLLWILPLRVIQLPKESSFDTMLKGKYFKGNAKVININLTPAYGKKGRNRTQLFNATVAVKDNLSNKFINLKWFNAYPNLKNQLEGLDSFTFMGIVNEYNGSYQIVNPKINPKEEKRNLLIEYPTVNKVSGNNIQKLIHKIPDNVWEQPLNYFSDELTDSLKIKPLNESFKVLHGLEEYEKDTYSEAKETLVYFEFLKDQLKVVARKMAFKNITRNKFTINQQKINNFTSKFPYKLTPDQDKVCQEIFKDFSSPNPMMRIVQGDVGCGKTTVAQIAAFATIDNKEQIAIMCPTETLARQHYNSFKEIFDDSVTIELLVGSMSAKEKNSLYASLEVGNTDIVIGTHSLFQKNVEFKNLGFAVIDEQHKFGVEQRLKLVSKGQGVHCLLMSATPIPRTLQLAQYGDLDISTIKSIPSNRKGIQTRILNKDTYEKYLSFIKTRVSLKEQVYVVVPAITESEVLDIKNVESVLKQYKSFFPKLKIQALHGQLKAEEKTQIMEDFKVGSIDILISTSVIEVGINVHNATVMSIYNPERFGLSSLHQLRGRVGRGEKPGFCFLIPDQNASKESLKRLAILEKSSDGFDIAEADLKNRGEGDLFGSHQSGNISHYKVASIFENFETFEKVQNDVNKVKQSTPHLFDPLIKELLKDKKVSTTI